MDIDRQAAIREEELAKALNKYLGKWVGINTDSEVAYSSDTLSGLVEQIPENSDITVFKVSPYSVKIRK